MRQLIIFLFALSLPLGDQLNPVLGFSVSNMFMLVIIIAILFLPTISNVIIKIPQSYKWFYVYVVLHTILFYTTKYSGTLSDLCEIEIYGNVISAEPYYMILLRYFSYLFAPIVITTYISNENHLICFFKCFVVCFIVSMMISYTYNVTVLNNVRFSGGFHDPNTFGGFSVIALFMSLYLHGEKRNSIYVMLSIFFLLCILISESRSSLLGLVVGFLYLFFAGYISKRVFVGIMMIALIGVGYMISNDVGVIGRFSQVTEREGGDSRILIWLLYLENIYSYLFLGTGLGHKFDAVIWGYSMRSTHNMYLLQLVQFGVIGFLLFVQTTYSMFRGFINYSRCMSGLKPLTATVLAFLVLFFFSDYDNTREYTILVSMYFVCYKLYNRRMLWL